MKKTLLNRIIILIVAILCCSGTYAAGKGGVKSSSKSLNKWSQRRYEMHTGLGFTNFMGDICSPRSSSKQVWILPFKTTGYVSNGLLKYQLTERQYVSGGVSVGYMAARETIQKQAKYYYRDGITFKTGFAELAARYEFMFIKEKNRRNVYRSLNETKLKNFTMPSYIFIGVGGIFNAGNFYWNDFTSKPIKGRDRYHEFYYNFAPVVMGGVGCKVRVDRNTYVGVELGNRLAINDGIDHCDGNKSPTEDHPWHFGKWFDQYQFATVSLVFKMREKRNHMPNFKTIGR